MRIEGYKVLNVAGEGSYGIVLKAKDLSTGEIMAIKRFKGADDDSTKRELRILSMLQHPNIIHMVNAGYMFLYLHTYIHKHIMRIPASYYQYIIHHKHFCTRNRNLVLDAVGDCILPLNM